jgi:hypothetical protein
MQRTIFGPARQACETGGLTAQAVSPTPLGTIERSTLKPLLE